MATSGEILDNGNVQLRFLKTTRDSRGELVEVEATYRPASQAPPRHFHPSQTEVFNILDGRMFFELDGKRHEVRASQSITVPPGAVHRAWNPDTSETKVIWQTRPALQTEAFFEAMWKATRNGRPNLLQLAVLMKKYQDTFVLASPPRLVQSCVFGLLAPIARALGYR